MQLVRCRWWWVLGVLSLAAADQEPTLLCEPRSVQPFVHIPGEAIITAFIDAHTGENCTIPVAAGLEQTAALVWAVSEANSVGLVPGVNIGIEIFDTCGSTVISQRAALAALSESDCDGHYTLGILSSYRTALAIRPLLAALELEQLSRLLPEQKTRGAVATAIAAIEVIKAGGVRQTAIVAHSTHALTVFSAAADHQDICVTSQQLFENSDEEPEDAELSELEGEGVVVLLGPWASIKAHLNQQQPRGVNMTKLIWILAPTDAPWEAVTDDAAGLAQGTLVLAPSAEPSLHLDSVVTQETLEALGAKLVGAEAPIPELRRAASVILEAAGRLREALLEDCGQVAMCAALRPLTDRNASITGLDASWAQGSLEPPISARQAPLEPIVRLGRIETEGGVLEPVGDLEKGHIKAENGSTVNLTLRIEGGCGRDCVCINQVYRPTVWSLIIWRGEIWVAVVTSVAGVGVALSLAVAVFIIVRIAKGDVLEGNPTFSFVLLFGVVLTYMGVLPYCAAGPRLLCVLRELGTSLGHALMLSVMLARAIMLTTTDEQGFMSHVSGYLQFALWFFIVAVQVALTTQFLMFNSQELLAMPASVEGQLATCHDHRWSLVALMSYDALLLVLLLLVSPLVARSKRNYREGIFFCVAAWLSAVCWGLWVSGFMLLGTEWRAACIAFGHCACASVVLGSVFVPRTYLIVSSVTRARIASAIPAAAAAYSSSTNILDIQYRSNQALYDSVRNVHRIGEGGVPAAPPLPKSPMRPGASGGVSNPNFYAEEPRGTHSAASTLRAGRGTRGRTPSPEHTYTRYDSPPSPLKVTRF